MISVTTPPTDGETEPHREAPNVYLTAGWGALQDEDSRGAVAEFDKPFALNARLQVAYYGLGLTPSRSWHPWDALEPLQEATACAARLTGC